MIWIILLTTIPHNESSTGMYDTYVHTAVDAFPYIVGAYLGVVLFAFHDIIKERL